MINFRDELKRNYNLGQYWLEVDLEDVSSFDEALAEKLYKLPTEHLPLVRETLQTTHWTSPSGKRNFTNYPEHLPLVRETLLVSVDLI